MNVSFNTGLRLDSGFALQQNNQRLMDGLRNPGSLSHAEEKAEKKIIVYLIINQ